MPMQRPARGSRRGARGRIDAAMQAGHKALAMAEIKPLEPGTVIRPVAGEWHPHMPAQLDEEELADWRAGRAAVYQLAALTVGARLAVADG